MKIADFFAEIGFKVNMKSLQDFNNGMLTVVNTVKGLALGLTSAMTAWELMQLKIGKGSQNVLNFKTYTGESIQEVQKLAAVMQGTNLNFSMDTLLSDITSVKMQLRELQLFGEGSSMAQALRVVGISGLDPSAMNTVQDFLKMLRRIPDEATRALLAQKMGLSNQFLNILDLTDEQYEKLVQLAPKIYPSEEELRRRQKATLDIYLVWLELVNIFETKVTDFAPVLQGILEKIRDILNDSNKLKTVVEGVKWTFILTTLLSVGSALSVILANLRGIVAVAGIAGGIKIAQNINEKLGIENTSAKGLTTQGVGAVGGMAAAGGLWFALKRLFGGGAVRSATGSAAANLSKTQLRTLGAAIGRTAGKAAARQGAAGAANINPWVAGGLAAWGLFDIGKAIYDVVRTNEPVNTRGTLPSNDSLPPLPARLLTEQENYNWSSSLASMTINAQNVYLNATRVYNGDTMPSIQRNSYVENNVARSTYNVEGSW